MRRLALVLVLVAVVSGACSDPNEEAEELRAFTRLSAREPKTLTFRSASEEQAYEVRGTFEDELRYSMTLTLAGKPLVDYVVRDDALAVRLRDAAFGARLANVLGDPVVDAALKSGRWVIDPAGAPPLIRSEVRAGGEAVSDPFRDTQDAIRFIEQAMGQSSEVKEFTLEDIEYRSALDPWRYPTQNDGEARYDLVRPLLPTNESATLGAQGDIGPAQFRKTSIFVQGRRVRQICSLVDVQGHEEFVELREQGADSNPFLATLLERIREKETAIPIEERYVFVEIDYPRSAAVGVPPDAVTGKLETFLTALEGGFGAGVLRPTGRLDTTECRRTVPRSPGRPRALRSLLDRAVVARAGVVGVPEDVVSAFPLPGDVALALAHRAPASGPVARCAAAA